MNGDAAYFSRRASEERAAADSALGAAREAHLQMAERYDELAAAITAREPEQPLRATA